MAIEIATIGFTKKSAEQFFTALKAARLKRVVDVRLNNLSQLAGFSKRQDLQYFLREICGIEYLHLPELAPTKEMLDAYKKGRGDWDLYAKRFLDLMAARHIEDQVPKEILDGGCLLCSEDKPHYCHRRLVAEYLAGHWNGVRITHLG
jgi:uncharacterized protein (DUF488 family)